MAGPPSVKPAESASSTGGRSLPGAPPPSLMSRSPTPDLDEQEAVEWPRKCLECCARSHYPVPPACNIHSVHSEKCQPCSNCISMDRVCVAPVRGSEGFERGVRRLVHEMKEGAVSYEGAYLAIKWVAEMVGDWEELEGLMGTTEMKSYVAQVKKSEPQPQW
ncbi:hypothetical protein P154DRAFT_602559 [Amniculicola lignicola CBS 123094]|uniref:Uncharacterized protein n=1 Tax=Amniculicola lignicola CBS 123094 TaxID=1392246 RepID=A0A6A5WM74_9PLEO|nr:hypothetical protein P154DRAFT_602559 [Amniculicola lignicola CBS 123094]